MRPKTISASLNTNVDWASSMFLISSQKQNPLRFDKHFIVIQCGPFYLAGAESIMSLQKAPKVL